MMKRRTEDGAEKCSLRLFLLEECFATVRFASANTIILTLERYKDILALTFAIVCGCCDANGFKACLHSNVRLDILAKCAASTIKAKAKLVW